MEKIFHNMYMDTSIVFELLASMFRVQCHEQLMPENLKHSNRVPLELSKWVENARQILDEDTKKELEVFFNFESFLGLNLISLIFTSKKHKDIKEFLLFLKAADAKDIVYSFLFTGYGQGHMIKSVDNPQEVLCYLQQSALPEVEKWKLFYFCCNPEDTKHRLITLIETFYNKIFTHDIDRLTQIHEKSIQELKMEFSTNPQEKLFSLIDMDKNIFKQDDKVFLFPSYYYNTSSLFSYDGDIDTLIYLCGTQKPAITFNDTFDQSKILEAAKAISDENRIKIIKILNTTPCYGYELAQKLNLSSSTISHHLSMLTSHGIISACREENKVYYEVNKSQIKEILDNLYKVLTL
jgi:DNA-binding transcriptional ArsR family regulator